MNHSARCITGKSPRVPPSPISIFRCNTSRPNDRIRVVNNRLPHLSSTWFRLYGSLMSLYLFTGRGHLSLDQGLAYHQERGWRFKLHVLRHQWYMSTRPLRRFRHLLAVRKVDAETQRKTRSHDPCLCFNLVKRSLQLSTTQDVKIASGWCRNKSESRQRGRARTYVKLQLYVHLSQTQSSAAQAKADVFMINTRMIEMNHGSSHHVFPLVSVGMQMQGTVIR